MTLQSRMALAVVLLLVVSMARASAVIDVVTWVDEHAGERVFMTRLVRAGQSASALDGGALHPTGDDHPTDAYGIGFGAPGIDLVLDFHRAEDRPRARLSVVAEADRDAVDIGAEGFVLPSAPLQVIELWPEALGEGWTIEGEANFDMEGREYDGEGIAVQELAVGRAGPGVPAWATYELLLDPDVTAGYPRFKANVLADPEVGFELAEPLLPQWPFLSAGRVREHYGPNQPLYYNITSRRLEQYWAGFHVAGIYWINSLSRPPLVDFEAPFAFYRFDDTFGRYPNLTIRTDRWTPRSPFGPRPLGTPRTAVRMTWTAEDVGLWRYSISGIGQHALDELVAVGRVEIEAVSYDDLPTWIVSRPWLATTFVEATAGERGSEGIYDYSVEDNYVVSHWVNGVSEHRPTVFDTPFLTSPDAPYDGYYTPQSLREGFRGEYGLAHAREVSLYASPVDGRLHLAYAEAGLWNLGADHVLRSHNLNGDALLDCWSLERAQDAEPQGGGVWSRRALADEVVERLCARHGQIVHADTAGVTIAPGFDERSIVDLAVPTDEASWRRATNVAARFEALERDPWDLHGWFARLAGPRLFLTGATLDDVEIAPAGLTAMITIGAAAEARGGLTIDGLIGAPPGSYMVHYDRDSGRWSAERATAPRLTVDVSTGDVVSLQPTGVELRIVNQGTAPFNGPIEVHIGGRTVASWPHVRILGRSELVRTIGWTPSSSGLVELEVMAGLERIAAAPLIVDAFPRATAFQAFELSVGRSRDVHVIAQALTVLACIALLLVIWRRV
jgi:hypothetical protein